MFCKRDFISPAAHLAKKVGDAVRQDASFSTAGPSEYQNGTIGLPDGGRLHVVEDFRFQEHLSRFAASVVNALFMWKLLRLQ